MTDRPTNARLKPILLAAGLFDLALAAFIFLFGAELFHIERRIAMIVAAALAAGGVSIVAVAVVSRRNDVARRSGEPVIRR